MVRWDVPFYVKILLKVTIKKADFQSIFARSASAVTSSEKRFNKNTNRKSTTGFPMSLLR